MSFVSLLQCYTGHLQVSLKLISFSFYPININVLNFTEKMQREQVFCGITVFAYLPVKYFPSAGDEFISVSTSWIISRSSRNFSLFNMLQTFHECMDLYLSEISKIEVEWFVCDHRRSKNTTPPLHVIYIHFIRSRGRRQDGN